MDAELTWESQLLRYYDVTIAHPLKPWTSVCWGIFFQEDFDVFIEPRKS